MATLSNDLRPARGSLAGAAQVQLRVIKALILREMHTRYGRENIGLLWLVLEPMLLATTIAALHSRGARVHQGDITAVPMCLIGYCNFMAFRSIFNRAEGAIEQSLPLLYHRTVKPFDVLLARALLDTAGVLGALAILMGAAVALELTHLPVRPGWYMAGTFFMFWFSFASSLMVAGLTYERRALGRLVHPFTYLMMPLSGAFFTMNMMPGPIRTIFLYNPLVHIFEILRFGWFNSASGRWFSLPYLLTMLTLITAFGLVLLAGARKRIHMP